MIKRLIYTLIFCLGLMLPAHNLKAQDYNSIADSLSRKLLQTSNDTGKLEILQSLSFYLVLTSQFDSAKHYAEYALRIQSELTEKVENGEIRVSKGLLNNAKGAAFNNLGLAYEKEGNFIRGLDYFQKALKIYEDAGNRARIAGILSNIGTIHKSQGDYEKALDYYNRALAINKEVNNKEWIAANLNNIASIQRNLQQYSKSLNSFRECLKISEELKHQFGIGIVSGNLGSLYKAIADSMSSAGTSENQIKNMQDQAFHYLNYCLEVTKKTKNLESHMHALAVLGELYLQTGDIQKARTNLVKALEMANEYKIIEYQSQFNFSLSELYKSTGEFKLAYKHLLDHRLYKDSLFSIEKEKGLARKEARFEFERKEERLRFEQQEKELLYKAELKNQQVQRNAWLGGFGLMLLLAGVSYRSYRNKKKSHTVIEEQKKLVEAKNLEIVDSINYARRIQSAILPPAQRIRKYLPGSFVIYLPKDIIAGDFYWFEKSGDMIFFAVADCTGHGVPGALVSVMCNSALNRSVKEFGIKDPANILGKTREIILSEFENSEETVRDGMDISLCALNLKTHQLDWAGANNPLWIIRAGTGSIEELKGDKQPVGRYEHLIPFTSHRTKLNSGDTLYLFSDGYIDQFGGKWGKKLKTVGFRQLLLSVSGLPAEEQHEQILKHFQAWKEPHEQVDDVCVMGVVIG